MNWAYARGGLVGDALRRAVITGGGGFLGSQVVQQALQVGWEVTTIAHASRPDVAGTRTLVCDPADSEALAACFAGADVLVHCAGLAHVFGAAAKDANAFRRVNGDDVKAAVDAAVMAGVKHIVLASSVSVYGEYTGASCDEEQPCRPEGAYPESKLLGETLARQAVEGTDVSLTILRFATIYGEGDRGNIARLTRALASGRFLKIGSGRNFKSFLHKADAARACVVAMGRPLPGVSVFNVSATPVTVAQIVESICTALGRKPPRWGVSDAAAERITAIARALGDPARVGHQLHKLTKNDVYDATKFQQTFDFATEVSLDDGVRREVASLVGER